jgi:two-component system CheB/CheR fusion protein
MPTALDLVLDGKTVDIKDQPLAKAIRTGHAVPPYEARIEKPGADAVDVTISATPLFDESGKVRGAVSTLVDISQHKEAERSQERLLHELQHRVKNILATVTALTSRMMRSSSSMTDFSGAFQERLQAMARTHELLSSSNWAGADLGKLLRATLKSYTGKSRIVTEGRPFRLNPSATATLGMVFFELASNAAKYGALSADKGRVEITWRVRKAGSLSIKWKEVGGPAVKKAPKRNFGTNFIQQSLEYELGGTVDLRFSPSGLECLLEVPLSKIEVPGSGSVPATAGKA